MDDESLRAQTDEQLLALAKVAQPLRDGPAAARGRTAFDLFLTRHRAFAVNLARGYVGDPEIAQDFAQEGFLQLYRMLPRYQPMGTPRGLLARIVRNACLTYLQRERRTVRLETLLACGDRSAEMIASVPEAATPPESLTEGQGPVDRVAQVEASQAVREAMGALNTLQQEAILLRYFQDCPYEDIAVTLGISVNYVGVILHQALRTLRDALGDHA